MPKSFLLSCARHDDEPFVARLRADLTARGFEVRWVRVCGMRKCECRMSKDLEQRSLPVSEGRPTSSLVIRDSAFATPQRKVAKGCAKRSALLASKPVLLVLDDVWQRVRAEPSTSSARVAMRLFEAVEKWRNADRLPSSESRLQAAPNRVNAELQTQPARASRLFWILCTPGVGKSAFAAQLTHTRGDTVIAAQFCERDKPDHRNAPRVVRSLAFQLATRLPDYRKLLLTLPEIAELDRKDAAELFDCLLANPLRSVIHGGPERYLIVIDALAEAGESGRNPLVEMLARNAQRLPDWLGLVVTSRPEFDVKTPLQALNPFPLDTQSESNRADIRDAKRKTVESSFAATFGNN